MGHSISMNPVGRSIMLALPGMLLLPFAYAAGVLFDVSVGGKSYAGYGPSLTWSLMYVIAFPLLWWARGSLRGTFEDGTRALATHSSPGFDTISKTPRPSVKVTICIALAALGFLALDVLPVALKFAHLDCPIERICFADDEPDWSIAHAYSDEPHARSLNMAFDIAAYAMELVLVTMVFHWAAELFLMMRVVARAADTWATGEGDTGPIPDVKNADGRCGLSPLGPFFRRAYSLVFVLGAVLGIHWAQQAPPGVRAWLIGELFPSAASPAAGPADAKALFLIQWDGARPAIYRVAEGTARTEGAVYEAVPVSENTTLIGERAREAAAELPGERKQDTGTFLLWGGTLAATVCCLWPVVRIHLGLRRHHNRLWRNFMRNKSNAKTLPRQLETIARAVPWPCGRGWAIQLLLPAVLALVVTLAPILLVPTLALAGPLLWSRARQAALAGGDE